MALEVSSLFLMIARLIADLSSFLSQAEQRQPIGGAGGAAAGTRVYLRNSPSLSGTSGPGDSGRGLGAFPRLSARVAGLVSRPSRGRKAGG